MRRPRRPGEDKVRQTFGNNVRNRRLRLNWSQETAADNCEMDRSYFGGVERGQRNVSLDNIVRMARGLETKAVELLKGIE